MTWVRCGGCDDWYCTRHEMHTADCDCPEIQDWDEDPYEAHPSAHSGGRLMRYLLVVAIAAALALTAAPAEAAPPPYCQPGYFPQYDMAGVYESWEEQMRVTVYPCSGVRVMWSNPYGTHEAYYQTVETLDGGGIIARLHTADPMVRSLDGRNVVSVKPAERGYVQAVTVGPYGDNFRVYRLKKIA